MARNYKEPVQKANVLRITGPSPSAAPSAQPRERTFDMTMKDAVQNADVAAGMLDINPVEVIVLMDSGATRSFIAESVIARLMCVAYSLEPNLIREVADQGRVTARRICLICDRIIKGRHFSADLILFKLGEFDFLLGMCYGLKLIYIIAVFNNKEREIQGSILTALVFRDSICLNKMPTYLADCQGSSQKT